jgi:DNA repair exonuclease SbcCD ATPase subunit
MDAKAIGELVAEVRKTMGLADVAWGHSGGINRPSWEQWGGVYLTKLCAAIEQLQRELRAELAEGGRRLNEVKEQRDSLKREYDKLSADNTYHEQMAMQRGDLVAAAVEEVKALQGQVDRLREIKRRLYKHAYGDQALFDAIHTSHSTAGDKLNAFDWDQLLDAALAQSDEPKGKP